jgi:RNA polymerase sigma factor (sigma-70 family)
MAKIKICFILENGVYMEIPYSEIYFEKKRNPKYADRYFLPYDGYLMEVPFEHYQTELKDKERQKYLHKQASQNGEMSYDALDTDEMNGEELIQDIYTDVEQEVITQSLIAKLRLAIRQLTADEIGLVEALYYQELSERQYAAILGISQKGINKRRHKVLAKLKKIIEKI